MVNPNNWYQSKVRPGVAAVAGSVMVFGGSSGGEVARPCVGLCVVAGGSRRCGSRSCVGPAGRAVLNGVCRRRGRVFVARPCVGLCMGAGVAAVDHVLVLPDVCARRAYVAKEEGRSSGYISVCHRRRRAGVCRLASGPFVGLGMEAFVRHGRVAPGEDGVCAPTGVWRPDPKKRRPDHVLILRGGVCALGDVCHPEKEAASERGETASFIAAGGSTPAAAVWLGGMEKVAVVAAASARKTGQQRGRRRGVRTAVMIRSPSHD
jgi:hypothetical protein